MVTGHSDTASLLTADPPPHHNILSPPVPRAMKQLIGFTDILHLQLHLSWAEICPLQSRYEELQVAP